MTNRASLHYSIEQILADECFHPPEFIQDLFAEIKVHKNVVLQGPTGTGKTWLAQRFARAITGDNFDEHSTSVAFYSGVTHENFILGIRYPLAPQEPRSSPFLKLIDQANANPQHFFILIIEELNRGDPIAIFQSTLQRLPADRRTHDSADQSASLVNGLNVPPNIYIIATMCYTTPLPSLEFTQLNKAFQFITIPPCFNDSWLNYTAAALRMAPQELVPIQRRITAVNEYISRHRALGTSYQLGHAYLTPPNQLAHPQQWLQNQLKHQIPGTLAFMFEQYRPEESREVIDIFENG